ncbi:SDR family oxidoreductase [Svornostia abyssi]|uniref:SDR family oxidoreductase n=1 Tax=Svornostia abyssi TaxID=2898438 RepID=A0ABY5PBF0_9ACTN|nr:SDR family oxidoreductase [Parviterribacteraceae bacterium J379]
MTTLLTGFPGFIGTRLVARLLDDDPELRVVALVEPRLAGRAREVATGLPGGDRIEILEGDITDPKLGLSADRYDALAGEVRDVFHLAAVYDLAVGEEIARRVNVEGTKHVVAFCEACTDLHRHNYVSTCYVAGLRTGLVLESELEQGQEFKNFYESTKYAAEVVVRNSMDRVPTTVFRPGIVVGDSRTGETQKFDGPYFILRAISAFARYGMPLMKMGRADAPFNAVPVDFIIDALAVGSRLPETEGETLQLVDQQPLSAASLVELLAEVYAGRPPKLPTWMPSLEAALSVKPIRALVGGVPPESLRYLNHRVRYDGSRTAALLGPHGVHCPPFSSYVGTFVDFFRQHEHDAAYAPAH